MPLLQFPARKYKKSVEWVKQHSYKIDSLANAEDHDFDFLENILRDKRIVWLGENGHGIAEHNLLKCKLIHFLYHKMGFKVIAFESGLSECYSANYLKETISLEEFMDTSIFSLWKTEETLPLFKLIKNTDLNLIGFDFQPSSKRNLFVDFLNKLDMDFPLEFKKNFENVDEALMKWYTCFGSAKSNRKKVPKPVVKEFVLDQRKLAECISSLHKTLKGLEKDFDRKGMHVYFQVIQKVLENKQVLLYNLAKGHRSYGKVRDQMMANNLEWICKEIYPNEKMIVWAHNGHIYKNLKTMLYKPMGSLVSPDIVRQSYYIGLFMYEGKAAFNNGIIYDIKKPPKKSLEDYMNHSNAPVSFLDLSDVLQTESNKWIFRKTIFLESGTMENVMIPADQLDGIFFVKKVSPPHYLKN